MKRTKLYLDGKRIARKAVKSKFIDSEIKHLQNVCFPKDMSISKSYNLSNGQTLKIFVSSIQNKK